MIWLSVLQAVGALTSFFLVLTSETRMGQLIWMGIGVVCALGLIANMEVAKTPPAANTIRANAIQANDGFDPRVYKVINEQENYRELK